MLGITPPQQARDETRWDSDDQRIHGRVENEAKPDRGEWHDPKPAPSTDSLSGLSARESCALVVTRWIGGRAPSD